ncbi:MAG: aminotransferase class I/II-fold pyridoxal phosphate-dependent enzyme, partial [Nitrosopumilaceae archaeon]|nr:aminotransferase class I/II-fold pyridoxal phosphate-dependent enzyme [Nitrosopumilaceae archaeon]
QEIIEKMSKLQALCLTNVSEPIQYVAMQSLNEDVSSNSKIIEKRLEVISDKAKEMNLEFVKPDGAMYLFARVNKQGFDGVQFANTLLEHGLAVAPGEGFGEFRDFIRISACQEEKKLMEGMDILNNILRSES